MAEPWNEAQLDEAVAEVFALMLERTCTPATVSELAPVADALSASVMFSGTLVGTCAVHLATDSLGELTGSHADEDSSP